VRRLAAALSSASLLAEATAFQKPTPAFLDKVQMQAITGC
jgi:hypothetical protein